MIDSKYGKEIEVQINIIEGTKSLIETCLLLVSCKVSLGKINDVLESYQGKLFLFFMWILNISTIVKAI